MVLRARPGLLRSNAWLQNACPAARCRCTASTTAVPVAVYLDRSGKMAALRAVSPTTAVSGSRDRKVPGRGRGVRVCVEDLAPGAEHLSLICSIGDGWTSRAASASRQAIASSRRSTHSTPLFDTFWDEIPEEGTRDVQAVQGTMATVRWPASPPAIAADFEADRAPSSMSTSFVHSLGQRTRCEEAAARTTSSASLSVGRQHVSAFIRSSPCSRNSGRSCRAAAPFFPSPTWPASWRRSTDTAAACSWPRPPSKATRGRWRSKPDGKVRPFPREHDSSAATLRIARPPAPSASSRRWSNTWPPTRRSPRNWSGWE